MAKAEASFPDLAAAWWGQTDVGAALDSITTTAQENARRATVAGEQLQYEADLRVDGAPTDTIQELELKALDGDDATQRSKVLARMRAEFTADTTFPQTFDYDPTGNFPRQRELEVLQASLNLALSDRRQRIVIVYGPSGCGKSTILKMLVLTLTRQPVLYCNSSDLVPEDDVMKVIDNAQRRGLSPGHHPVIIIDDAHQKDVAKIVTYAMNKDSVRIIVAGSGFNWIGVLKELPSTKRVWCAIVIHFVTDSTVLRAWVKARYGPTAEASCEVCGGHFPSYEVLHGVPDLHAAVEPPESVGVCLPIARTSHHQTVNQLMRTYQFGLTDFVAALEDDKQMTALYELFVQNKACPDGVPSFAYRVAGFDPLYVPTLPMMLNLVLAKNRVVDCSPFSAEMMQRRVEQLCLDTPK